MPLRWWVLTVVAAATAAQSGCSSCDQNACSDSVLFTGPAPSVSGSVDVEVCVADTCATAQFDGEQCAGATPSGSLRCGLAGAELWITLEAGAVGITANDGDAYALLITSSEPDPLVSSTGELTVSEIRPSGCKLACQASTVAFQ